MKKAGPVRKTRPLFKQSAKDGERVAWALSSKFLVYGVLQALARFELCLGRCRDLHWFTGTRIAAG